MSTPAAHRPCGPASRDCAAMAALARVGVTDLAVVSVAKGSNRRAGQEQLFFPGQDAALILTDDSPALRLIQRVRDQRIGLRLRSPAIARSQPALSAERFLAFDPSAAGRWCKAFGGLQGVRQASVEGLARYHGISRQLLGENL